MALTKTRPVPDWQHATVPNERQLETYGNEAWEGYTADYEKVRFSKGRRGIRGTLVFKKQEEDKLSKFLREGDLFSWPKVLVWRRGYKIPVDGKIIFTSVGEIELQANGARVFIIKDSEDN